MARIAIGLLAAATLIAVTGCRNTPPPQVAVPDRTGGNPYATRENDPARPLPQHADRGTGLPVAPFQDEPLLSQRPPEQRAFVDAYERVGRPRIAVLVNPQLKAGAEDELAARAIDYTAMETILADWFSANGRVLLVSPTAARQRLTDQQVQDLQSGDLSVARKIADELAADVLVQVQVHPTRQAGQPAARIVTEAVNVRGGQSIGRAVVDLPPPLQKTQINEFTRYLARKMMDDMASTWNAMPPGPPVPLPEPAVPQRLPLAPPNAPPPAEIPPSTAPAPTTLPTPSTINP